MSSSGTWSWSPSVGDLILNAFSRINLRGPELSAQHLQDAATECNLLNTQFSNRNPNQWELQTSPISLVQGTSSYSLPSNVVALGVVYLTTSSGISSAYDRPLVPISAADYAAIPNKATQGSPTTHWVNLSIPAPIITLWPVPDNNGPYVLNIQYYRQSQDISVSGGQTLDAPFRFYDAFVAGLAARLARLYAPALYQLRKQDWEEAWNEAASRDQEDANFYIVPGLSNYFR